MPLGPGTRLGPYEILSALGAGGMGEVYRATDMNLGRQVAIKVLPEAFANDPERMARFEREAKTLASLNHQNIAIIHGLEKSQGTYALVMELVEGEDLSQRISRGPIPLDEALPIASQIAEALEAAHEQGIIHRDLKPANIKVRADGTVKVLDFGLAKLAEQQPLTRTSNISMSPTITSPALVSGVGVLLGTAAYMSPEQAKGKPADKRSDIWAFGCVLFEMLTGKRPFDGEDVTDVIVAILGKEPADLSRLTDDVPVAIRTLLRRCLEKDRRRRVADISTALFTIEEAGVLAAAAQAPTAGSLARQIPRWRRLWIYSAPAVIAGLSIGGAGVWFATRPVSLSQASVRFQIPAPGATPAEMFTLSPDGKALAFIANAGGENQLWVRSMSAVDARALPGTQGAIYPFWSPDGAFIGFFVQGKLKKIAIAGGPAQTLCDAISGRGGTWNRDGVVLFSPGPQSPIFRVAAGGGSAVPVTKLAAGESAAGHRFPMFLPDGVHFLYNAGSDSPEASGVFVGSLDGTPPVRILPDLTNALFVPAVDGRGNGRLLFRREETLVAQPFDPNRLRLSGEALPLAEDVPISVNTGFGAFSASANGTLAYRTGGSGANRELAWFDRSGKRIAAATHADAFVGPPALSADQRTIAVRINRGSQSDIWLQDVTRNVISRFTFRPGLVQGPVWAPDGKRLAFSVQDFSVYSSVIYLKPSGGSGPEQQLLQGGVNRIPQDWSSDGRWLLYQEQGQQTGNDLWLMSPDGDRKPIPYLQTPFNETNGRFAPQPDAPRWIAYQSDESGQNQIYIQSNPPGAKYQISTTGGTQPRWRSDAKELFYVSTDSKLMVVPVTLGQDVQLGPAQEVFASASFTGYVPAPDAQRFLFNVPAGEGRVAPPAITIVLNWADEKR